MATVSMPAPGGLATRGTPPFRLPGEHFAAALAFLCAGAVLLVRAAPDIALGLFPLPRVAAVTHLLTLGWITTSIMGALYQFLPVALAQPIRWQRLAHATFFLHVPGVALFVAGLLSNAPVTRTLGAALFGTALLLFALNLAATLRRAETRDVTWWALAAATASLVITVLLGIALALNLSRGFLGNARFLALAVHIHVAAAGWVLLVMMGVGRHLLPMFLLSHGVGDGGNKLAVALVAAGVAWLVLFHHAPTFVFVPPATLLVAAGVAAFLLQAGRLYRHSVKPKLDPGMRLVAAALALLGLAVLLAPLALWRGYADPRTAVAYVAALIPGALSLFVAAHYYKIVPFLVWYHRFGPLAGKRPLPRVADLYDERGASAAAALLVLGALGLVGATLAGSPAAARLATVVFAGGVAILTTQMIRVAQRRPEPEQAEAARGSQRTQRKA